MNRIKEIVHIGTWYLNLVTNVVECSEELYKMYGLDSNLPIPQYAGHVKFFTKES